MNQIRTDTTQGRKTRTQVVGSQSKLLFQDMNNEEASSEDPVAATNRKDAIEEEHTDCEDGEDASFPEKKKICVSCGIASEEVKHCMGCKFVQYCSPVCQRKHWKDHKPLCHELPNVVEKINAAAGSQDWRTVIIFADRLSEITQLQTPLDRIDTLKVFANAYSQAMHYHKKKDYAPYIIILMKQLVQLFEACEMFGDQVTYLTKIADLFQNTLGNEGEAVKFYTRAIDLAQQHDLVLQQSRVIQGIALLAMGNGRVDEATNMYRYAMELLDCSDIASELHEREQDDLTEIRNEPDNPERDFMNHQMEAIESVLTAIWVQGGSEDAGDLVVRFLKLASKCSLSDGRVCIGELDAMIHSAKFYEVYKDAKKYSREVHRLLNLIDENMNRLLEKGDALVKLMERMKTRLQMFNNKDQDKKARRKFRDLTERAEQSLRGIHV